jgi:hypothetical protein
MRGRQAGLIAPGIVLVVALLAGREALRYGLWSDGNPGSGLLPLIACVLLVVLSLLDLSSRWRAVDPAGRAGTTAAQSLGAAPEPSTSVPEPAMWHRVAAYGAALLGFAFGMDVVGFVPASVVALAVAVRFGEGRDMWRAVAVAGAGTGFAWLLFAKLLSVPLPTGRLLGLL